jgi:hypothetical protein
MKGVPATVTVNTLFSDASIVVCDAKSKEQLSTTCKGVWICVAFREIEKFRIYFGTPIAHF